MKMKYYIYFLVSEKDGGIYIGRTKNIERRLKEHCYGLVASTRSRRPLRLLGYEVCYHEAESIRLEMEWKKSHKRAEIKQRYGLK